MQFSSDATQLKTRRKNKLLFKISTFRLAIFDLYVTITGFVLKAFSVKCNPPHFKKMPSY